MDEIVSMVEQELDRRRETTEDITLLITYKKWPYQPKIPEPNHHNWQNQVLSLINPWQ
jgi:hypothetical protein